MGLRSLAPINASAAATRVAKSVRADVAWNMPTTSLRATTVPPAAVIAATAAAGATPSSATTVYSTSAVGAAVAGPAGAGRTRARPVGGGAGPAWGGALLGTLPPGPGPAEFLRRKLRDGKGHPHPK